MLKLTLALAALFLLVPARALAGDASIFYYPWYGTPQLDGSYQHWDQGGHVPPVDLASTYYPARGAYSSSDVRVVGAQMREIAKAGIREIVSSWWGWGSIEDDRLPMIARMARAQGLQVAVQIEPYPDRTATTVQADLVHLRQLGVGRFYVYHPFEIDEASWASLLGGLTGVQVLAQTTNIARAASAGFAGIYTYDIFEYGPATFAAICARARQAHLLCAPSVGPGFDALRATSDTHSRPRRNGATYDAMWQAAIDARADRVTITSYNEWHEGTQIEPALAPVPRSPASGSRRTASPVVEAYASYDGAYGSHGATASRAYLARTAFWTALYRTGRGITRSPSVSATRTEAAGNRGRTPKQGPWWRLIVRPSVLLALCAEFPAAGPFAPSQATCFWRPSRLGSTLQCA